MLPPFYRKKGKMSMVFRNFFTVVGVIVCANAVSVAVVRIWVALSGKRIEVIISDRRRFHTAKPYDQRKEEGDNA